jgi:hypothetical protein
VPTELRSALVVPEQATQEDDMPAIDRVRFRNTEILIFDGEKIAVAEVYFGWNLD